MDRSVLLAIVVVFMFVLLSLLIVGWRRRQKRQSTIAALTAPPPDHGKVLGEFDGKYVATTVADQPFDRIAVHGLGFRGPVCLEVTDAGLVVRIAGTPDFWIARDAVRGIHRATWTIDRAVEKDGLHVVAWSLGDHDVDSYLRLDEPTLFDAATAGLTEKASA